MNKTLRKFILIAVVIAAVVCVVGAAGAAIIYLVNRSQSAAAAAYAPPDVQITSPADGAEVDSGSNLVVSATAQGAQPVTRAELWVDGQLLATQDPNNPNGDSLLYASFPLQVQAGNHLVFVRALNTQGVIGQSMPISIIGVNPVNVTDEGQPIEGTGPTGPIANPVKTGELPVTGNTAGSAGGGVAVPPPNNPPVVIINPNPLAVNPPPGGGNNPMLKLLPALGIGNNPLLKIPSLSGIGLNSPPAPPTGLQGWVDNCQLTLVWDDKATNESSYEIWIAGTGQAPQVFVTLSSANSQGQAWTMLAAPNPGTYTVWVEAVNWLGKGLSNIIQITVTNCPNTFPAQLYIEAKDLIVPNAIDLVYCYVTIGTAPQAVRIPVDITQFITTVGGSTNIADFAAGQKAMVIPRPAGNTLAMFGDCDGWAGSKYTILGTFNESFTSDKWNSTPQKVTLGSSSMTITIHPSPTAPKNTIAGFNDPTLPMPFNLKLSRVGDANGDLAQKFMWENQRQLSWAFLGNTNQFSGYNIYLDGKFSNKVPGAITFSTIVTLPPVCNSGAHVKWQVSAVDPSGKESSKSLPAVLDCAGNVLVEVRFAELVFNSPEETRVT